MAVEVKQLCFALMNAALYSLTFKHFLHSIAEIRHFIVCMTFQPAHDKTYNKTCVTNKDRPACTSTQYGKGSWSSLFGPEAVEGTCDQ